MTELSICVAIITRNRRKLLENLLAALIQQVPSDGRHEVLVVDNNSNDDTLEILTSWRKNYPFIRVVSEARPGVYSARNTALRECRADIVALLDDDLIVADDWFQNLIALHEDYRNFAQPYLVGGRVLVEDFSPAEHPPWFTPQLRNFLTEIDLGPETFVLKPDENGIGGGTLSLPIRYIRELGDCGPSNLLFGGDERVIEERILAAGGIRVYAGNLKAKHFFFRERISRKWYLRRLFTEGRVTTEALRRKGNLNIRRALRWGGYAALLSPVVLLSLVTNSPKIFRLGLQGAHTYGKFFQYLKG